MKRGITFSTFDLFHAGHILMLQEAKTRCDWLIACIQTDPTIDRPEKNKPLQSIFERYIQVKGCILVDETLSRLTSDPQVNSVRCKDYRGRI